MPEQTAHTLTKAELADALFEQIGLTKRESKQAVDVFFALISERLAAGEEVKLTGFGNFNTRMKASGAACESALPPSRGSQRQPWPSYRPCSSCLCMLQNPLAIPTAHPLYPTTSTTNLKRPRPSA